MSAQFTVNLERTSAAGIESFAPKDVFAVRVEEKDVLDPDTVRRAVAWLSRSELIAFRESIDAALEGK